MLSINLFVHPSVQMPIVYIEHCESLCTLSYMIETKKKNIFLNTSSKPGYKNKTSAIHTQYEISHSGTNNQATMQ